MAWNIFIFLVIVFIKHDIFTFLIESISSSLLIIFLFSLVGVVHLPENDENYINKELVIMNVYYVV